MVRGRQQEAPGGAVRRPPSMRQRIVLAPMRGGGRSSPARRGRAGGRHVRRAGRGGGGCVRLVVDSGRTPRPSARREWGCVGDDTSEWGGAGRRWGGVRLGTPGQVGGWWGAGGLHRFASVLPSERGRAVPGRG